MNTCLIATFIRGLYRTMIRYNLNVQYIQGVQQTDNKQNTDYPTKSCILLINNHFFQTVKFAYDIISRIFIAFTNVHDLTLSDLLLNSINKIKSTSSLAQGLTERYSLTFNKQYMCTTLEPLSMIRGFNPRYSTGHQTLNQLIAC